MSGAEPWPTELVLSRGGRVIRCAYDTGERFDIPFALLRSMTPSAEARGHGGDVSTPVPGDFSSVEVLRLEPVGAYAVRPVFSDGHASGIYTWEHLRRIGAMAPRRS